jgi:hypothetical protein
LPIGLLFARQRCLALSVRPAGDVISVALDLRGEFPPGAEHNFRSLVRSMAQAPLGAALGLPELADNLAVRVDENGVLLSGRLETSRLETSLKFMFAQEMRALLE